MKLPLGWSIILMLFFVAATPVHAGDWTGEIITVDGVVHVRNPAEPAADELILESEQLWAFGEESGEDDVLIGAITQALIDDNGNTYFLDSHISQVIVYDSGGQFVRTMGRSGEGPGEFQTPITMGFLPGRRLGVVQMMPARIVAFTLDGEPLADFPAPGAEGFATVQDIVGAGESVVAAIQSTSFDSKKITVTGNLFCLDKNGKSVSTLWEKSFEQNMGNIVIGDESNTVLPVWAAGGQAKVYINPSYDDYRIDVMDMEGKTVRVIEREYESRKRTDEELDQRKKLLDQMPAGMGNIDIKIDETDRDIEEMLIRDNGELWVFSSHSKDKQKEDVLGPFDVFDSEGRYIRNASISADYESKKDTWFIHKNRLYVIKRGASAIKNAFGSIAGIAGMGLGDLEGDEEEDEDDLLPPVVVCYRIGYATN
jgi:hypothetical protein